MDVKCHAPPFARELPDHYLEVWIFIGGTDSDLAWRLARWRSRARLPALLVPTGSDPLGYSWPALAGAEALVVILEGAPSEAVPRLSLQLFNAGASVVRAVDTEEGRLTVYRRQVRRAAA